jgi:hypothetical protein
MGNVHVFVIHKFKISHPHHVIALDPRFKLTPYRNDPQKYQSARKELIDMVCF